jgi:type I restriction enzyme S subunit
MRIAKKSHFVIRSGDVIYNKLFAWKGTFGVVPPELDGMFVSDKFPTYEAARSKVDPSFLGWYFRHPGLWEQARAMSTGSAALSKLTLNPPKFLQLEIPLPPLEEQRRIAAKLDVLSARVTRAQVSCTQAADGTDALLRSSRLRVFGEKPGSDWPTLSEYVAALEAGKSPATEGRPATTGEWAVLKVGAVSFGLFDDRENKALPVSFVPITRFEVKPGDFLMSRANTRELVGACAVVRATRPRLMLSDKTFRFVFREPLEVVPEYLEQVLKARALRDQIEAQASGTSPTMKNISQEKVLALRVPRRPLAEQHKIVGELAVLQAKVDALKPLQADTAAELEALMPALLDRAFRGEL